MKTKKTKPKNRLISSGFKRPAKRCINLKGKWKAVEIDPSLFSEGGLEGLVCFEELSNYRLVDEKAAAKAANELKKKKAKKRKVSEAKDVDVKGEEESKDGESTSEPAKKKAKKKKGKVAAKVDVESDNNGKDVEQVDKSTIEEGQENEAANEDTEKVSSVISEDAQSNVTKRKEKLRKKKKVTTDKNAVAEKEPNLEAPSDKGRPQQNLTQPPKKQIKNWTNVALSSSVDKNCDVSAWKNLFVPPPVLNALSSLGFGSPTPIQALALPPAIRDRMDILGAAETGKILFYFF